MMRRLLSTDILNVDDHAKIKATKEIEVNGKQLAKVEQIPTNISDLTNDSDFITSAALPTKTSQLTNDSGYITSTSVPTKTSQLTNDSDFITAAEVPEVDNRRIRKAVAIPHGSPEPSLVLNIDTDVDTFIVITPIPNPTATGKIGFQDYSLILSTAHFKEYVNKIMYLAYDSSESNIKVTSVTDNTYKVYVNWFNSGIGTDHALSIIVL